MEKKMELIKKIDEVNAIRSNVLNTAIAAIIQSAYIMLMMIFVGKVMVNVSAIMGIISLIFYAICTSYLFRKAGEDEMKKNYVSYGIISMVNLSLSVIISVLYFIGFPLPAVIVGISVGLIWTIIFLIAYSDQRKEYKILKEKLDEELKEGMK